MRLAPEAFPDFELVALFGSTARGTARPDSDRDIAVLPRDPLARAPKDLWERIYAQVGPGELDVVWLPDAGWLLWAEVARDGQPWLEARPGAFESFRGQARARSQDADLWRDRERRFLDRFAKGDWTVNRDLVRRKLVQMEGYLRELEPIVQAPLEEFKQPTFHYAAERLIELVVECAASINNEVAQAQGIPPSDYHSSFFSMARTRWVDHDVCARLAESARLRNALVHRYTELAVDDVYAGLQCFAPLWRDYALAVAAKV